MVWVCGFAFRCLGIYLVGGLCLALNDHEPSGMLWTLL
jgi:hypothetical protein